MPGNDNNKLSPADLMAQWLQARLSAGQYHWLDSQLQKVLAANTERDLHITLGLIPRKLIRDDLNLSQPEQAAAEQARRGWQPQHWNIDRTARIYVLCKLAERDDEVFADTIVDLCRHADLNEAIALYSGACVYPDSPQLNAQLAEGLRSNMRAVFEAIAHHSPYPAEHFDENRWNHMVLKALFIDSTLAPIQGLDERANAELARILCDYAHERQAAGRPVTVELWRCVGPFASGDILDDLLRVSESEDALQQTAALLALSASNDSQAQQQLTHFPAQQAAIASGALNWNTLTTYCAA